MLEKNRDDPEGLRREGIVAGLDVEFLVCPEDGEDRVEVCEGIGELVGSIDGSVVRRGLEGIDVGRSDTSENNVYDSQGKCARKPKSQTSAERRRCDEIVRGVAEERCADQAGTDKNKRTVDEGFVPEEYGEYFSENLLI